MKPYGSSGIGADNLQVIQMDIKTALLNGHFQEEVFMEQSGWFINPGQDSKVCRFHK